MHIFLFLDDGLNKNMDIALYFQVTFGKYRAKHFDVVTLMLLDWAAPAPPNKQAWTAAPTQHAGC